jgi:hypothetical protein
LCFPFFSLFSGSSCLSLCADPGVTSSFGRRCSLRGREGGAQEQGRAQWYADEPSPLFIHDRQRFPLLPAADVYKQFFALFAQLFDCAIDNAKFEDECRVLLGTKSYELYTLDKVSREGGIGSVYGP